MICLNKKEKEKKEIITNCINHEIIAMNANNYSHKIYYFRFKMIYNKWQ